ncbi:cytochrome c3 family protein [Maridesulfovibrio sp.]|uniref:cytochrome c3 family protein n=1 Tax=Maridesulfovibrio sp. TaxID=2795000 RepID=UPI0029CA0529|nr:cytochrome c3 family protein [Maridesulfovibrio sp.]
MKNSKKFAFGAILLLFAMGIFLAPNALRAQDKAEKEKSVAEIDMEQHKAKQFTIDIIDDVVFGKLPVKSYHKKVHQNGANCELCHGVKAPTAPPDTRNCANCHGTPEDVAKRTEKLEPNPHKSPHWATELPCDTCHREHGKSEFYCKNCHHFDYQVP